MFVLRHAHSSWALPGQRDHQRALDDRGRQDAKRLAEAIEAEGLSIDRTHCSSATRAKETLEIIEPAFKSIGETVMSDDLYALGPEAYVSAMCANPDASTVLIIGHNPMIEDFCLSLVAEDSKAWFKLREGLPTCGFVEFAVTEGDDGFETLKNGGGTMQRILLPREMA
ncbi:hypothetical protein FP2506_08886 [Fulvimarina pelagi HTCC2506]|uniref:Phosphohistidine phosphatase n=1 Tax=Fulvimarina pelagi HTCC2506 TaxID=314231 RepID=Q0G5W9_9HYPH|nr:histidine phosphatase family protein [Fulvimarina pelagi]EAU42945.1 hypothetical protein FP2506_08886 [Fulvimarina pelagi HTCC2506]